MEEKLRYDIIKNRKNHIVRINDTLDENISNDDFIKCRDKILSAFEEILPDRCSFEK